MLEIIASTVEDARLIAEGGADRIELVSALSEGGLTPSYGLMLQAVRAVAIPVNVMIRPHSRSFVYSDEDLGCMLEDIKQAKAVGANGVVLGVLDAAGSIALPSLKEMLRYCSGLEVTFHRAIDEAADILGAAELLASLPIDRVLSSGGRGQAEANLDVLRQMHSILAAKGKLLLVGSGVNPDNCQAILQATKAQELHVGTSVRCGFSAFENVNPAAVDAMAAAYNTAKGD